VAAFAGWAVIGASSASAAVPQTLSYYVDTESTTTLYNWGYNAPGDLSGNGALGIILDFGRPAYRSSDGVYGTIDWNGVSGHFVPNGTILALMEAFARGWYNGHSGNIAIAQGVNNCSVDSIDPGCPAHTSYDLPSHLGWITAAQKWAAFCDKFDNWLASSGYWGRVVGEAAIDAEPDYDSTYSHTANFVGEFNNDVTWAWNYDFGAPYTGTWNMQELYTIAYGVTADEPWAEVYNQSMATEWANLSQWGANNSKNGAIYFQGVMCTTVGLDCSTAYSDLVRALSKVKYIGINEWKTKIKFG
jgi:hypothetical protein